ncbi:MAG: hypothetical protein ACREBV_06680 [Candidatus Zixiibacteriota bacterium]
MGNRTSNNSIALLIFAAVITLGIIISGCGSGEESSNTMPTRDINTVMESHTLELMAIKGVVGVAIGENEEKKPCIMVLIVGESEEMLQRIPKEIEGHPVCPFESGDIKPLRGS